MGDFIEIFKVMAIVMGMYSLLHYKGCRELSVSRDEITTEAEGR